MILFLTSSPCVPDADRAILNNANGFVERLRKALPKNPKCLFVCSSPDSPALTDKFGRDMASVFQAADMGFREFQVLDPRTDSNAQEMIWNSDLIILAGGHVPTQNAYFQKIGLAKLLKNYQGVVLGISAGSMNAATEVYAQPEYPDEATDPAYQRFLPGLALANIRILPHYQKVRHDILNGLRLFEDITYPDSVGRTFYAFPDGTYYYQEGTTAAIFGECYRLRNFLMTRVNDNGSVLFDVR